MAATEVKEAQGHAAVMATAVAVAETASWVVKARKGVAQTAVQLAVVAAQAAAAPHLAAQLHPQGPSRATLCPKR